MEIYQNHPLAPYTTVKIGGPADTFITTNTTAEFIEVLKKVSEVNNFSAHSERVTRSGQPEGSEHRKNSFTSATILGNGSNVLISDSGIRGIVIKNLSNTIEYLPNNLVKVDSGVQLPFLITNTINHSLSGLEEFTYIPATIGGAIYSNIHGINKNNFDKFISEIEIFDLKTNSLTTSSTNKLNWSYDTSEFQSHPNLIILAATLKLNSGNPDTSREIITNITAKKTQTQSMNSLGSVFKNPKNDFAGRIIDQELHLKGFQIGDAQISPLHGNFILNLAHATATDYLSLIKKIQKEAKDKLNLDLIPEIKFLGNFS